MKLIMTQHERGVPPCLLCTQKPMKELIACSNSDVTMSADHVVVNAF